MLPVLLLLLLSFTPAFKAETKAVAIIHRHGHRNPIGTYPKNPNVIKWPGGYGALTLQGSKDLFLHGQRLRARYNSLVKSDWYSAENINSLSSIVERSIMSAQSFLAGFLPPPTSNLPIWWQPAPVRTLAATEDNMIASSATCSKYSQIFNNYIANPPKEIQDFLDARPGYFRSLEHYSGMAVKTIFDAFILYNILLVETHNGVTLPAWGQEYLKDALSFYKNLLRMFTHTDYMKKTQVGALITDIFGKFNGVINNTETRTIYQYSGHDLTILGICRLLDIEHELPSIIDYGATLALELDYDKTRGTYNIIPFLWESANKLLPRKIKFPKCSQPCPINSFSKVYNYYLLSGVTYESIC